MGHPCRSVGPVASLRGRPAVSHISRKTSEIPRISCTQLSKGPRVRLSLRKAHEFQGTHETPQEIGGVGHPAIVAGIEPKRKWRSRGSAILKVTSIVARRWCRCRCRRVAGSETSLCLFLRDAWPALRLASDASRPAPARNREVR